jgi:hypothetical protein
MERNYTEQLRATRDALLATTNEIARQTSMPLSLLVLRRAATFLGINIPWHRRRSASIFGSVQLAA